MANSNRVSFKLKFVSKSFNCFFNMYYSFAEILLIMKHMILKLEVVVVRSAGTTSTVEEGHVAMPQTILIYTKKNLPYLAIVP